MSRRYKLIVFDWDGTLMDSLATIVSSMQQASQRMEIEMPTAAAVHEVVGLGLSEAIAQLFPQLTLAEVEIMRQHYSQLYIDSDQVPSRLYPGAKAMLDSLAAQEIPLSIATGKSRPGLNRVLAAVNVGHYFSSSRCADETQSKPHPQMLHEILWHHGLSARDALMVGDSEFDMEMALAAGVDRVAVSWGAHHVDRLKKFKPVACADSMSELCSWLNAACGTSVRAAF